MKTAIVGAGRKRNGIGQYIGKYFQKNGAHVVSVLGTTEQTVQKASLNLSQYGIRATGYTDFSRMMQKERPDVVVIASPILTHYEYVMKCVEEGVHIFCEKPFIWQEINAVDINPFVEDIFEKAENKNLIIAMNSQWPFSLSYYDLLLSFM